MTNEQLTEYLYDEIRDLNRINCYNELIIDAYKEEVIRLKDLYQQELTIQTNRAAQAEQELTATSFRLTMCNKMKSQAENELADLKMKGLKDAK